MVDVALYSCHQAMKSDGVTLGLTQKSSLLFYFFCYFLPSFMNENMKKEPGFN